MTYKRRLDKKSSRTAGYTCMCRAASYMEKDPLFKSDDNISVKLLPGFVKLLVKINLLNLKGRISPKGIYQYVIARTKYFDNIFKYAINSKYHQILILGAGFDSRAIRLLDPNSDIKVYEIDTCFTMEAKFMQYEKRKIHKPENNIFIPVDFENQDIRTTLKEKGFDENISTLFILEGLTMYLSQNVVEETFKLIYNYSGPDSIIVFDYIYASVLRLENKYYGEEAIYQRVKKDNEQWVFGIEEGEIERFLTNLNFKLVEHFDSVDLEKKYFKNESDEIVTKVNGTHCIVLAKKTGNISLIYPPL